MNMMLIPSGAHDVMREISFIQKYMLCPSLGQASGWALKLGMT